MKTLRLYLTQFLREEIAAITKETNGRLKVKKNRRNSWTITYLGSVWRSELTTREVAEFINGYRDKEKHKYDPGQMEAIRKAIAKLFPGGVK